MKLESLEILEHYKGNLYIVLHEAKHTETEEVMIVYTAFPQRENNVVWVRPADMFREEVEHNGEMVPRFKYKSHAF